MKPLPWVLSVLLVLCLLTGCRPAPSQTAYQPLASTNTDYFARRSIGRYQLVPARFTVVTMLGTNGEKTSDYRIFKIDTATGDAWSLFESTSDRSFITSWHPLPHDPEAMASNWLFYSRALQP